MKSFAVISLLLILLLSQFGHLVLFTIEEIRMEEAFEAKLLNKIPDTALEKIVDDGQLDWEKAGKEVFYQGNLYDIVRTGTENGRIIYYALKDHQEKQLIDTYAKNLRREESSKETKSNPGAKFNPIVFTLPGSATILWFAVTGTESTTDFAEKLPHNHSRPIPTPPWS